MARVTHKWVGEPHASESVKLVDGVPVARNHVPNPRFELGTGYWDAYPGRGDKSRRATSGLPYPQIGYYGAAVVTEPGDYVRLRSNYSSPITGEAVGMSAWVRTPDDVRARFVIDERESGEVSQYTSDWFEPTGTWQMMTHANILGPGDHEIRAAIETRRIDGSDLAVGEEIHVTGVAIVGADTEAEALAQVETYFDGDTEDYETSRFKTYTNGLWVPAQAKQFDGDSWVPAEARRGVPVSVTHEWTGTPHASESVKRIDGVEVARNLVPNPSFEVDLSGVSSTTTQIGTMPFSNSYVGERALQFDVQDDGYGFAGRITSDADSSGVDAGDWVAIIARVRRRGLPTDAQARLVLNWRDSLGTALGTKTGPREVIGWDWTTLTLTSQKPDGASRMDFRIEPEAGAETVGGLGHTDGWQITAGPTEAEALAQVAEYFDGDTEDYDTVSFSDP